MKTNQICLFCKDSGYVVYDGDDGTTLSAYCDCPYGDAAFHRDEDLMVDEEDRFPEDDQ